MATANPSLARTGAPSRRSSNGRRWLTSYLMMAPFLILFAVFVIYPLAQSAYFSLTKYTGIKAPEFIAFANYLDLIKDKRFVKAMSNVALYVLLVVLLNTLFGVVLALVFKAQGRVTQAFRTLFFLPAVTSSIAAFVVWGFILTGEDYGLANTVLRFLGLPPARFLSTPGLAIPIMVTLAL